MSEGGGEDEELDAEKEDETLAFGGLDGKDGIVVGCPDKDPQEDLVGDFDDYVGD